MKKSLFLVALISVLTTASREALAQIYFGLTPTVEVDKLYLVVSGPTNLSYSAQFSTNGVNWQSASVFATAYHGKPAFVKINTPPYGYYRALAYSNSVFYTSTNSPLVYSLRASAVGGNRQIQVLGPENLTYIIEGSTNLLVWTNVFTGTLGQTNFIDPLILPRFYRAKTQ